MNIHDPVSSLRYRWVVAGDWKLIVPHRPNEPGGAVELFDLNRDPGETKNLASAEPRQVERLAAWLTNGGWRDGNSARGLVPALVCLSDP